MKSSFGDYLNLIEKIKSENKKPLMDSSKIEYLSLKQVEKM